MIIPQQIKVRLGNRSYGIYIGDNALNSFGTLLKNRLKVDYYALLSNPFLFRKFGRSIKTHLRAKGIECQPILIGDGESNKNEKTLFIILKRMAEMGLQRDSGLIALGGGVIGDLGGLAASLYMRGINFIQCPTTLLAQVDASVGGKTAIDFYGIKNLVGAFYQPNLVLIDPRVLRTLDERQMRTGLAEIIKYGVIQDEKLFEHIEKKVQAFKDRESKFLSTLISRSCQIKADIVSADEKEAGKRAWLNYGHTLGHALESFYNYRVLTHGEAIAHGMHFAAILSARLGFCSESVVHRQFQLLKKSGLIHPLPRFSPADLYQKMLLDKKARKGQIQFVLTRKIGLVTIQKNIPRSTIFSVLNQFQVDTDSSH